MLFWTSGTFVACGDPVIPSLDSGLAHLRHLPTCTASRTRRTKIHCHWQQGKARQNWPQRRRVAGLKLESLIFITRNASQDMHWIELWYDRPSNPRLLHALPVFFVLSCCLSFYDHSLYLFRKLYRAGLEQSSQVYCCYWICPPQAVPETSRDVKVKIGEDNMTNAIAFASGSKRACICLLSLHQIEDKWHKRWLVCEERCKQHFGLLHMIVDRCLPWIARGEQVQTNAKEWMPAAGVALQNASKGHWGIRQTARTGTALQIGGKSNSKIFQASANLGTTLDPQGPRKRSTPCKIIVWLYTAKARVLQRDNDSWNSQAGHDCTNIA